VLFQIISWRYERTIVTGRHARVIGDLLPAGYVVAEQWHVLVVCHPTDEALDQ
jgi:hypothetical protein